MYIFIRRSLANMSLYVHKDAHICIFVYAQVDVTMLNFSQRKVFVIPVFYTLKCIRKESFLPFFLFFVSLNSCFFFFEKELNRTKLSPLMYSFYEIKATHLQCELLSVLCNLSAYSVANKQKSSGGRYELTGMKSLLKRPVLGFSRPYITFSFSFNIA